MEKDLYMGVKLHTELFYAIIPSLYNCMLIKHYRIVGNFLFTPRFQI